LPRRSLDSITKKYQRHLTFCQFLTAAGAAALGAQIKGMTVNSSASRDFYFIAHTGTFSPSKLVRCAESDLCLAREKPCE